MDDADGDGKKKEGETEPSNEDFSFLPGDHVCLPCNASGIPYDHHAIVLSARAPVDNGDNDENEWLLCVADFTADGADMSGASCGTISSGIGIGGTNDSQDTKKGLRVLTVSAREWRKVHYKVEANVGESSSTAPAPVSDCGTSIISPPEVVRSRVEFLLQNPEYIPAYSLVESNCECVAVWCKTGRWTTLQAASVLEHTNRGSRVALVGLTGLSQLAPLGVAVPGLGLAVAAGVLTEVCTGLWSSHAQKQWREQTDRLNAAFEARSLASPSGAAAAIAGEAEESTSAEEESHSQTYDGSVTAAYIDAQQYIGFGQQQHQQQQLFDPFCDERSLRAMINDSVR